MKTSKAYSPEVKMNFALFFAIYAVQKGWEVPRFHVRICEWLEKKGRVGVLLVFRGAGKSTIAAIYEAWKLYKNRDFRFLVQSADDELATMMTRDCRDILINHPDTEGMIKGKPAEHFFWVEGTSDKRNPSMRANGIMSNATGGRADEAIFDDVEVQKNVETEILRDKLRKRISEATHILVPGGMKLYIGTPHTEKSIYPELEAEGADVLKIPLLSHNQRIDDTEVTQLVTTIPTDDLIVFYGKKLLTDGEDYELKEGTLYFNRPLTGLIDLYSGNIWPERFTRAEIINRRRECRSLNEWDSQYLLRPRKLKESRLRPDRLIKYNDEPIFEKANGNLRCRLGDERITSIKTFWDVSLGKVKGDASALTILLQNEEGKYFWHRSIALEGDIHKQCNDLRKLVETFKIPNVAVEVQGLGGFVPAILRKVLSGTGCSVTEKTQTANKNKRIIDAIETPLSGGLLYAHESVINGRAYEQMGDWDATVADQPDDYIDSLASAILMAPVKIRRTWGETSGEVFNPLGITLEAEWIE